MTTWYGSELFSHPGELLVDHLRSVAERSRASVMALPLSEGWVDRDTLAGVASIVGLGHDLGKATAYFQRYLSSPSEREKAALRSDPRTHHAEMSAYMVADWIRSFLGQRAVGGMSSELIAAMAFAVVRRHHGGLQKLYDEVASPTTRHERVLREQWESVPATPFEELLASVGYPGTREELAQLFSRPRDALRAAERAVRRHVQAAPKVEPDLDAFLLMELLFSLVVDADRKDAAGVPKTLARREVLSQDVEDYRQRATWGCTRDVGELRNRLYEEVVGRVERAKNARQLTLTAPTGSGKTLAALGFALRLREQVAAERGYTPRIIYALPFLSIIDQTHKVFQNVLKEPASDVLLAHHHLSDVSYETEQGEFDTGVSEMLVEGWESEIVITTFVQLFHTLIGNRSRPLRRFWRTAGAIVLLDEVQCLPHRYWLLFRQAAEAHSRRFGTTFVLMTATQPAIFEPGKAVELVGSGSEFFGTLDRVDFEASLETTMDLGSLGEMVCAELERYPNRDALVVLNTVAAAQAFYDLVRRLMPGAGQFYFLSSHVVPKERLKRIQEARAVGSRKVIISTQVVEAGVDLDCDLVYRDFAPLDALVQVAGRCNRHGAKPWRGQTRVVRLVDTGTSTPSDCSQVDGRERKPRELSQYVYDSFLLECTRRAFGDSRCILREAEFVEVVRRYYRLVSEGLSDADSRDLLRAMSELNFDGGECSVSTFELIKDADQVDVFVELDDEASRLWARYQELRRVKDLGERRRGFAEIKGQFSQYMISVWRRKLERNPPPVEGGLGYIPRDQIERYYDVATGFRTPSAEVELW